MALVNEAGLAMARLHAALAERCARLYDRLAAHSVNTGQPLSYAVWERFWAVMVRQERETMARAMREAHGSGQ